MKNKMRRYIFFLIVSLSTLHLCAQEIGLHVNQGSSAFNPFEGFAILGDLGGDYLSLSPRFIQSRDQASGGFLSLNPQGGNVIFSGSGYVGIGTSGPDAKLHVLKDANAIRIEYNNRRHAFISIHESGAGRRAWLGFGSNEADDLYFTNEHSGSIVLYNDPGFLEITQSGRLYTNENGLRDIGDKKNMQYNSTTGEIGYDNSSRRYKINIQTLKDDWFKILEARPVRYTRPDSPDYWEYGYVAEEIDSIGLTNLVGYDAEGIPDDVKYDRMVLYQNEILRIQQSRIDQLEKLVAILKEKLMEIEKEN